MNVRMPLNIAVLFVVSTRVLKTWMNWNGMFATIPAKMMMETPFPMPYVEIWSPTHNRNMVPAVSTVATYK